MNLRINRSWQSVTTTDPSEWRAISDLFTSLRPLAKKSTLFLPFINWRRTNYAKNWKFLNNRPKARVDTLYWTMPTVIMTKKQVIFNSELLKVLSVLRGGHSHWHRVKSSSVSSVALKTIWTVHLLSDMFDLFRQWSCRHACFDVQTYKTPSIIARVDVGVCAPPPRPAHRPLMNRRGRSMIEFDKTWTKDTDDIEHSFQLLCFHFRSKRFRQVFLVNELNRVDRLRWCQSQSTYRWSIKHYKLMIRINFEEETEARFCTYD